MRPTISVQEKEIDSKISASVGQLQTQLHQSQENAAPEKSGQSSFENRMNEFLSLLKTENTPGLIQILQYLFDLLNSIHRRTGARLISRSQFLEQMRCFAKSKGLNFDKRLQNACLSKLQRS